jgi:hypothetical protein
MTMRLWILACALFAPALPAFPAEDIPGKIIFSVEQVDFELKRSDRPIGRTGIFYYYREAGPGQSSLTGYRFQDGKVTDLAGGGGEEVEEQVKKLKALPIASFDVASELVAARRKMQTQTRRIFSVSDGGTYRIRYDFNGVSIDYTGQTPGAYINVLAPFSENLTNLKALMDFLALSYGRRVFSQ